MSSHASSVVERYCEYLSTRDWAALGDGVLDPGILRIGPYGDQAFGFGSARSEESYRPA